MSVLDKKDGEKFALLVANTVRNLIKNGAEIYRAEDTARRMCSRYENIKYVNIYSTYNLVMVNFSLEGEDFFTMRTFQGVEYNLKKVARLNAFSRNFTNEKITLDEGLYIIEDIYMEENINILAMSLFAGLGSAFLIWNFDGGIQDFFITMIAAFLGQLALSISSKKELPLLINVIIGSMVAAIVCKFGIKLGFGTSLNIVTTGAIMPFLPGISFTNSIRDFLSGDNTSGLFALVQSLLVAAGMAIGVGSGFLLFP